MRYKIVVILVVISTAILFYPKNSGHIDNYHIYGEYDPKTNITINRNPDNYKCKCVGFIHDENMWESIFGKLSIPGIYDLYCYGIPHKCEAEIIYLQRVSPDDICIKDKRKVLC